MADGLPKDDGQTTTAELQPKRRPNNSRTAGGSTAKMHNDGRTKTVAQTVAGTTINGDRDKDDNRTKMNGRPNQPKP